MTYQHRVPKALVASHSHAVHNSLRWRLAEPNLPPGGTSILGSPELYPAPTKTQNPIPC